MGYERPLLYAFCFLRTLYQADTFDLSKGKCSVRPGGLKGLKQSNPAICEPRAQGDSHPFLSLIFHPIVQLTPSHVSGEALQVHAM